MITTAGGADGDRLLDLLAAEEVEVLHVRIEAPTRGTYTLVEDGRGELLEVHEPTGRADRGRGRAPRRALAGLPPSLVVAVCGSLPPGAPIDLHARLVATALRSGRVHDPRLLDAQGLRRGRSPRTRTWPPRTSPRPAALLGAELDPGRHAELVGDRAGDPRARRRRGLAQSRRRGQLVRRRRGEPPAHARPRPHAVVNAVGCGDALIGGFAAGLIAGRSPLAAAALGAAAATEKLAHLHPGAGRPRRGRGARPGSRSRRCEREATV